MPIYSMCRPVKLLLREALGLTPGGNGGRKADFAEFSGVWSEADHRQFEKKTEDLRRPRHV
ncbi:hypothetical protein [Anaerobaca lacustris]|uniref:Uncharacterized protein n=1 Tax=Anaerobaca lacustris TaxID=3044600 RepID=A0AAW6TWY2_9BACT|nr:hypothetical protein [Sedimentisphaerales bacterium M17dextr]